MKSYPFILIIAIFSRLPVIADDSFGKYDTNRDGMVTYEELIRSIKMEFDKLDRNRDFSISVREFEEWKEEPPAEFDFFHLANFGSPGDSFAISLTDYEEQIRLVINHLDTTADNAVSSDEYDAAVAEAKARAADPLAPKVRKNLRPIR